MVAPTGLKIEWMETDMLVAYSRDLKKHPDTQVSKIAASIENYGFNVPLVIDRDNEVVTGKGRLLAAKQLNMNMVPCIRVEHLTPEQLRAFRIADNKTAESKWIEDNLAFELKELMELDFDLEKTGFECCELDELLGDFDLKYGLTDPDKIPDSDITDREGLWALGEHLLLCGDAKSVEDIEKLMQGEQASMVFTDPPYNVDYSGKSGGREMKIKNDNLRKDEFYKLLYDAFSNMFNFTIEGGGIYICHADREWESFRCSMVEAGWLLKQCLIWVKNAFVLGRQDYHYRHEPILYGWKPGAAHQWYGGRKQDTVFEDTDCFSIENGTGPEKIINFKIENKIITLKVPCYEILSNGDESLDTIWYFQKPLKNKEHPTIKPVDLIERAVKNSSRQGDVVLDLFGGSGSTLIACERRGRRARIMELDPHFCGVIIQRWEDFTGNQAEKIQ